MSIYNQAKEYIMKNIDICCIKLFYLLSVLTKNYHELTLSAEEYNRIKK